MNYAEVIYETLVRLQMTAKDMALELGVDRSTVSRWISGEFQPSGLGKKALDKFLEKHKEL